ncbi:hypothetical protein NQ318_001091 [Aromia moschata]|uniref:Uncharacterized protein n=1 Tax=Aromia moschata TaxID=1265417 RepID=A0AAV8ZEL0_9CUCU|nr:hypothetical protein NQ318_001091 [Aromia moschata]
MTIILVNIFFKFILKKLSTLNLCDMYVEKLSKNFIYIFLISNIFCSVKLKMYSNGICIHTYVNSFK